MNNIKLSITTPLNNVIKIKTTQQQLSTCEYFKSLFGDVDDINNKLNINLTNFKYLNIENHVEILFTYICDPTQINKLKFNFDIYILIELCSYFGNDTVLQIIDTKLDEYYKNMLLYDYDEYEKFIINANFIYLSFQNTNKLDKFYEIAEKVNSYNINCSVILDIHDTNLYQCYDLVKLLPNNCIIPKSYKLFECYDMLDYSIAPWQKYDIKNKINDINYGNKSIISEDEFYVKFNTFTNNIFADIDWSNMVVAGGFIFGLINNISNSIIPSTDIDIFIYSTDIEVRKQKWSYLLEYFSTHQSIYVNDNGIINIIIPDLKFDIQIIVFHTDNPVNIIAEFDLNYVKLYYDGINVCSNIGALIGFKYQIADINIEFTKDLDKRICKTILKGLDIRKCIAIDKYSKLVDNNIIKIDDFDIKIFNKQNIVRQSKNIFARIDELYPGSDTITINYKEIEWHNVCDMFITYKSDTMNNNILLTMENINNIQNLYDTNLLANRYKVHNHIFDNKITNIYIDIGYECFTFCDGNEDYGNKNEAIIILYPNLETKKLLQIYGNKIGSLEINKNKEIRSRINKKMEKIKIKLSIFNIKESAFIDKIKSYYHNIGLNSGEMCLNNQMKIICNIEHLIDYNVGRRINNDCIFKINLSKLTFK